jgi:hypothetical protein
MNTRKITVEPEPGKSVDLPIEEHETIFKGDSIIIGNQFYFVQHIVWKPEETGTMTIWKPIYVLHDPELKQP